MATTVGTTRTAHKTPARTMVSGVLGLGAFALLIVGNHAATRMLETAKIGTSWGDWLMMEGMFMLAGAVFGFAAIMPRHIRYRFSRALILGTLPLLALIEMMLVAGPTSANNFTKAHLGYLYNHPITQLYYFGLWVLPVLLGVAIAAGFQSGD